jgi:hypothetical protein
VNIFKASLMIFAIALFSCNSEPDEKIQIPFIGISGEYDGEYFQCETINQAIENCDYVKDASVYINIHTYTEIILTENNEEITLYFVGTTADNEYEFYDANDDAHLVYNEEARRILYSPAQSFGLLVFRGLE